MPQQQDAHVAMINAPLCGQLFKLLASHPDQHGHTIFDQEYDFKTFNSQSRHHCHVEKGQHQIQDGGHNGSHEGLRKYN